MPSSCPQPARPYHVLLTASSGGCQAWQTIIFHYHYRRVKALDRCGEVGGFTRLLTQPAGSSADALSKQGMRTIVIDELTPQQPSACGATSGGSIAGALDGDDESAIDVSGAPKNSPWIVRMEPELKDRHEHWVQERAPTAEDEAASRFHYSSSQASSSGGFSAGSAESAEGAQAEAEPLRLLAERGFCVLRREGASAAMEARAREAMHW